MSRGGKASAKKDGAVAGPYRGGGEVAEPGQSDGLVGDLVRQFADPYAFFRELVQNAIDAGASAIAVRAAIVREGDGLEARLSVTDDGCGMSQEVLEEDLVVLFRSTKEGAEGKIGKFGIGFVSVLALAPSLVVVSTCTGDDVRHVLHLHPDRTYDLYREAGGTKGTTVTLHVPLEGDGRELIARSEAALRRWCGHAGVPITWTVVQTIDPAPSEAVRIDGPLAIEGALVEVLARSHDDRTEALVALVPESQRLAAYYNRGLLLHESRDRGTRAGIAFKVVDPSLSHTLSREDVRLDDAHARAVRLVEHTIRAPLMRAVREAIGDAAHAHVRGEDGAGARWLALVTAARAAELAIEPDEIEVPLLAPLAGARVVRCLGTSGSSLRADVRDALVDVMSTTGRAVIDRTIATTDEARRTLDALIGAIRVHPAQAPHEVATAIVPVNDVDARDIALLARIGDVLEAVLRRPKSLHWLDVIGAEREERVGFVLTRLEPQLALQRHVEADPFRFALRPALGISRVHPLIVAARAHADVVLAADVIVRALLIERDLVTEARAETLLEVGLRALVEQTR